MIKQGITQGSIVVPLIFPTYINNLPEQIGNGQKCITFDDDTTIIIPTDRNNDNYNFTPPV